MSPVVENQLTQLERAQLVHRSPEEEGEYTFRHVLTQETAYSSLLLKGRAAVHRRVAAAYERLYPDRLDEYAALLARHYRQAGDEAKTLEYARRAGDVSMRVYALAEAIAHYQLAIELAARAPGPVPLLAELYTRLGRALELSTRYADALKLYAEMEQVAQQRGDPALELVALLAQGKIRCTPNQLFDAAEGEALCDRAQQLAQALHDRAGEAVILWNRLNLYNLIGRLDEAEACGQESLAIARELGMREQIAFTLNDLAYLYATEPERQMQVLAEATRLWEELDNRPMLTDSLSSWSGAFFYVGELDRSLEMADRAFELAQAIENVWGQAYSRFYAGLVFAERGEMKRAIETMRQCIDLGLRSGFLGAVVNVQPVLGWLYGYLGDASTGRQIIEDALARTAQSQDMAHPWITIFHARLEAMNGNLERAEELAGQNFSMQKDLYVPMMVARLEIAAGRGDARTVLQLAEEMIPPIRRALRPFLPEVLLHQAGALERLERREEAEAVLHESEQESRSMNSRRTLWPVLQARARLAASSGRVDEGGELRAEARAIVQFIAEHTPSELRPLFLQRSQVRELFDV